VVAADSDPPFLLQHRRTAAADKEVAVEELLAGDKAAAAVVVAAVPYHSSSSWFEPCHHCLREPEWPMPLCPRGQECQEQRSHQLDSAVAAGCSSHPVVAVAAVVAGMVAAEPGLHPLDYLKRMIGFDHMAVEEEAGFPRCCKGCFAADIQADTNSAAAGFRTMIGSAGAVRTSSAAAEVAHTNFAEAAVRTNSIERVVEAVAAAVDIQRRIAGDSEQNHLAAATVVGTDLAVAAEAEAAAAVYSCTGTVAAVGIGSTNNSIAAAFPTAWHFPLAAGSFHLPLQAEEAGSSCFPLVVDSSFHLPSAAPADSLLLPFAAVQIALGSAVAIAVDYSEPYCCYD